MNNERKSATLVEYFVCPDCGERSATMNLSNDTYEPTRGDKMRRPWAAMEGIAGEILICQCGNRNTWFNMKIKKETVIHE